MHNTAISQENQNGRDDPPNVSLGACFFLFMLLMCTGVTIGWEMGATYFDQVLLKNVRNRLMKLNILDKIRRLCLFKSQSVSNKLQQRKQLTDGKHKNV